MKKLFSIVVFVAATATVWFFWSREESISSVVSPFSGKDEAAASSVQNAIPEPRSLVQSVPAIQSRLSLKERLARVEFDKTQFPKMAVAQILEPQDEVDLITLFYQETSIRDRLAYMVMMTKHGGDKSALAIIDMIKNQKGVFDGPAVDKNYTALHQGLVLLGNISVRSDVARQFLTEASDVEYWKLHRQYTMPEMYESHEDRYLAEGALFGLASGRHPEAMQIIQSMKEWETNRIAPWASALCDAAMWFGLSKTEDWPNFLFMDQSDKLSLCSNWKKTETGREWSAWSDKIRGIQ
jgi:hypothetical protein